MNKAKKLTLATALILIGCGQHDFSNIFGQQNEDELNDSSSSMTSSNSDGSSSSTSGGGLSGCPDYDATTQFCDTRDFSIYKYVNINGKIWMAENLRYETNNSRCYDNDFDNCEQYGELYNWDEARTACPSGWHLPDMAEMQALIAHAGGEEIAGLKVRTTSGWKGGNGTDDYDFSALPAGSDDGYGSFLGMNYYGCWWSSAALNADSARGFITGNFEALVDSITEGMMSQFGGLGLAIDDICNPDAFTKMLLSQMSQMGEDVDSIFGGSIFGKNACDLKDDFDNMLVIGSEDKRRLISVRCLKDE